MPCVPSIKDNGHDMSPQNTTEQLLDSGPVEDMTQGTKARKSRKTKVMEIRGETQTSTILGSSRLDIGTANISFSKDESGISYGPQAETQEFCRANNDAAHQGCD